MADSGIVEIVDGGATLLVHVRDDHALIQDSNSEFITVVEAALEGCPCTTISFDLSFATTVSSSFLAFLLVLRKRGITVEVLRPPEAVREYLEVTKLDALFEIRES